MSLKHWTEMESHSLAFPFPPYIYSDTATRLRKQTKNPILKHMLKTWNDVQKYFIDPHLLS